MVKFESDIFQNNEDMVPKIQEFLQAFVWRRVKAGSLQWPYSRYFKRRDP